MRDLDYWDEVRLAHELRGAACPVCTEPWTCGQDVHERRPVVLASGDVVCENCLCDLDGLPHVRTLFTRHRDLCADRADELTDKDREFVIRVAVGEEEDLRDWEYERLAQIVGRLENE